MGFCTFCGKQLADGEVCTCQQTAPRPEEDDDLAPMQLVSTTTMLMAKRDIIVFFIFYINSILYYNILTLLCLFLPFFIRLMSC